MNLLTLLKFVFLLLLFIMIGGDGTLLLVLLLETILRMGGLVEVVAGVVVSDVVVSLCSGL